MDLERLERLFQRLDALGAERHSVKVDWEDVRDAYGVLPPEAYMRIVENFLVFRIWNAFTLMDPFIDTEFCGESSIYFQEDIHGLYLCDLNGYLEADWGEGHPRPELPENGSMFAWAYSGGGYLSCMVKDFATLPDVFLVDGAETKYIGKDVLTVIEGMLDQSIPVPSFSDTDDWDPTCDEPLMLYEFNHDLLLPKYKPLFPRKPALPVR